SLPVSISVLNAPTGMPPSKPADTARWPLGATDAGWNVDSEGAQPATAPTTPMNPNVIAISIGVRDATPHGITNARAPPRGSPPRGGADASSSSGLSGRDGLGGAGAGARADGDLLRLHLGPLRDAHGEHAILHVGRD